MSWTKKQFVVQAYEEIGMANYVFDLQPEQLQSAARRLDAMMALWNSKGIRIGYPITTEPEDVDLDTETNVPDAANEAIFQNLAIKLAPGLGKVVPQELKMSAADGLRTLTERGSRPANRQTPKGWPRGAGNKTWRRNSTFTQEPVEGLEAGDDSNIEFK